MGSFFLIMNSYKLSLNALRHEVLHVHLHEACKPQAPPNNSPVEITANKNMVNEYTCLSIGKTLSCL